MLRVSVVLTRKPAHTPVPKRTTDAAADKRAVSAAATTERQCRPATRATGSSRPRCGLNVRTPNKMPARTGRRGSWSNPQQKRLVVRKEVWPCVTVQNTAGKARPTHSVSGFGKIRHNAARYPASPSASQAASDCRYGNSANGDTMRREEGG